MLLNGLTVIAVVFLASFIVFGIEHINDPQIKKQAPPPIIRITTTYDKYGNEKIDNVKVIYKTEEYKK